MVTFRRFERLSTDDLMSLASERGSMPLQVGAVLMLDASESLEPGLVMDAIADRVRAVPRLRQRLVQVPWGCGRPVWVDDRDFAVTSHFSAIRCPAPGGESAVLEVAAEMLLTRLPRDRPLWRAKLVTNTGGRGAALIVVFHHVLADGVGGLAVLAGLVDAGLDGRATAGHGSEFPPPVFPTPMPSLRQLAIEAMTDRMRSAAELPVLLRRLRGGTSQLRPVFNARLPRTSLNRPTGTGRHFATVRVDLDQVRSPAHAHQATVNDVVLSAVAAALHRLLAIRGEQLDDLVISVPFSTRREASASDLGNKSGVIPLRVPGVGDPARRLESLAVATRAAKQAQRGASTALLGPFFRLLSTAGLFRWFVDRQRLIHTFVSNVRGPEIRLSFLERPITSIIPLSAASGNVTVSFAVLSYAGSLTITLVADPDTCPDLIALRDALEDEVHVLTAALSHR
ncbi:MAG: wax ester/triacylglycerol synthase domain-containing protein [Dermatophilaceae bacterium]